MLALTLVFCLGFDVFLHYKVRWKDSLGFVLLFEPVLLRSSGVRKPR